MDKVISADSLTLPDFFGRENLTTLTGVTASQLARDFLGPVSEYVNRPRKNFRASLVEIGALLLSKDGTDAAANNLTLIKDAVECLHAGSLVIDDIQDGSPHRRGLPAFHQQYGTPHAICSGNWMYFWPLRLLNRVEWPPETKLQAYECFHRALELAHYGQFLDLTTKASAMEVRHLAEISIRTAELKTGTITALAFELGALAAGADTEILKAISAFGKDFGLALQRLDDWGNLCCERGDGKRFEDLLMQKPSTVWHDVASFGTEYDVNTLVAAAKALPEQQPILTWIADSQVPPLASENITQALYEAIESLSRRLALPASSQGLIRLKNITEELLNAYK